MHIEIRHRIMRRINPRWWQWIPSARLLIVGPLAIFYGRDR